MSFSRLLRSKIASLLSPWLDEELELELSMGFLKWAAIAKKLIFSSSSLNPLIENSTRLLFRWVKVGEISFKVSHWGFPFLAVEVKSVDMILNISLSEVVEEKVCLRDVGAEKRKEAIVALDPEGALLHEIIERVLAKASSGNRLVTRLANGMLKCCKIQFMNICVQLQFVNDTHACVLKVDSFSLQPHSRNQSSLFSSLVGLQFTSNVDNAVTIDCNSIEFRLKENDHTNRITSITGTSVHVRLNNFQPIEYSAEIPNVFLNIPPEKIPIFMVLLDVLSSKATVKEKRSGQELWKIAAEKFDPWLLGSNFSFFMAAKTVLIWSRYVHAYKSLLLVVGFYAYKKSIEETAMVSINRKQLRLVKHQWILVNELEKKLPVEAVACARQVARYRQLSRANLPDSNTSTTVIMDLFLKFVNLLLVLWRAICFIFMVNNSNSLVSNDSEVHFSLCFGEVNVRIPHTGQVIIGEELGNASHARDLKYTSLCFTVRGICVEYTSLIILTSFFAALSELEVCIISSRMDQFKTKNIEFEADDKSDLILWGDPAILHHSPEESTGTSFGNVDEGLTPVLKKSIRDLGSYWESFVTKHDKMNIPHKNTPYVLCGQKNFLIDPCIKKGCHGFSKCNIAVGKLNIVLENSSLLFVTMLVNELQHYNQLTNKVERERGLSNSSVLVDSSQVEGANILLFWIHRIKEIILTTIPDKNIEIGALIAGPKICISSQKLNSLTTEEIDNYCFAFDIENFEFAVWSASKSILGELTNEEGFNKSALEYVWLKEPQILARNIHTNGFFYCEGHIPLNVCMRVNNITVFVHDLESTDQYKILEPLSLTLQSSTCRDYVHSINVTTNIVSIAMDAFSTDVVLYLYMDELWTFLQVFKGIFSIKLPCGNGFESITFDDSKDLIRKFMTDARKNSENMDVPISIPKTKKINTNAQILVDASLELDAVYIILNDSRKIFSSQSLVNPDRASSSTNSYIDKASSRKKYKNIELFDLPEFGIGFFLKELSAQVVGACNHLDIIINYSKIQSIIFNRQSALEACIGTSQIETFLVTSSECLNQFILSDSVFSIHIGSHDATLSSSKDIDGVECYKFDASHHNSQVNCPNHVLQTCQSVSISTLEATEGCSLLLGIQLGKICVHANCMKSIDGDHQANKLEFLVKVSEELQSVNCNVQGGTLYLEPSALAMFAHCLGTYILFISMHPVLLQYNSGKLLRESDFTMEMPDNSPSVEESSDSLPESATRSNNMVSFQDVTVHISQFSITLAGKGASEGEIQELIMEIDLRLESLNSMSKLFLNLDELTFLARYLHTCDLNESEISLIPHFLSSTEDHQFTISTTSKRENLVEKTASDSAIYVSSILEHMTGSLMTEKLISDSRVDSVLPISSDWVGSGSICGAEFRMTLNDIQTISSLFLPLSGISSGKGIQKPKQSVRAISQGRNTDSDHIIPDGAVVAIKDLHEHMYFAVESIAEKYQVVGVLHYTLVGERSLFRVKYHKGWWSQEPQVSLTSLFAKNKHGEPLCLNFTSGSGFVEVSSSDDKKQALWHILPYKSNSSEDDDDLNSYFLNKTFHLVNRKNNCSIAFIDGLPEFVKKPGNPLKVKVFNEFPLARSMRLNDSNGSSDATCDTENVLPHVNIFVSKFSLTIFHDNSDANGKLPFFHGSINDISIISQIISSKFRIISSFRVAIQYMDAPRNLWRDILSPVSSSLFFHSKFMNLDASNGYEGVPAHLFFSMRQVDLSLTETSVDILLYLIGKLDIAGPFAVRTNNIFTNFCKLENHSGLNLICQFPDNEDVKLAARQSTSVFLRQVAINQLPDTRNLASICLSEEGKFSTSPINVLLSKSCYFAWRTRALSLKDSRSFPGPFIVTEVTKKSEEGLCISVSPLIKISNESGLSMELRFDRPQEIGEYATILLKSGDVIDDSVAGFDALQLSGGSRKALMSLALGSFQLFIKPDIEKFVENKQSASVEWSEVLQGGKAQRLSGIFDKLNYKLKKAFGNESVKSFFSTLSCPLIVDGRQVSCLYILVQTIVRDVPVIQPPNPSDKSSSGSSPVAMQLQKEIFIYPTIQVYNLLQTEILVHVTENHPDMSMIEQSNDIGNRVTIPCESSAVLYANPASMHINVTLTTYSSRCKPVSSSDWVKKLNKQKSVLQHMDIELDFGGGKYFASLRLTRAEKGYLEATIFSSYTFQNYTEFPLFVASYNQKPLSWEELRKYNSNTPPEKGCLLPPNSKGSWFSKSGKVQLKQLEEKTSMPLLDLDMLSGFSEVCLDGHDEIGISRLTKLGVSLQPCAQNPHLPSQVVCIVSRYVIANESKMPILVRQCYLQGDLGEVTQVDGKQKRSLSIRTLKKKHQDRSIIDSIFKRHKDLDDNSQAFFQFSLKDDGYSWSGPICIASLGRFFLKFKRSSTELSDQSNNSKFALVHVIEESSSLVLHFYMPENVALPYRVENYLRGSSVMYHQKDSIDSVTLRSGDSAGYVWDDLNLPHKLVVEVPELHLMREINIDKMCSWKPLFKMRRGMVMNLPLNKGYGKEKETLDKYGPDIFKVGYEIYADGPTRVLRVCETADRYKEEKAVQPSIGMNFVISSFAVNLLEKDKQDADDSSESQVFSTIIVARLANISLNFLITDRFKYYQIGVQSLNMDEKWHGAPFASMIRRSRLQDYGSNENILDISVILNSTNLSAKEVKRSSIILQPIDLKIDEETLMRLVPFWRTSLSTSKTPSQQFFFKSFEIHPIKITASYLPGNPYASYSSAQEALRTLLHSVIKVPAVNNKVIELNGILLTNAFVTFRELIIKCAQHYSWYVVRAIYIAKGSPLLPPAFASIFDDTASSSLDIFFDPSDGSISLPGLSLGMFKFISKCINSKGSFGTKRYFGDLGKTIKTAGSNALFAAVTEISDSILRGAEVDGFKGMVNGFHHGIMRLAMEPSFLGAAVLEGGPDRKILLDRSPGVDELYIEGYLQAMLDVMYMQEYLRVRVIDNQVILKNLPPSSSVINDIVESVKSFLVSKALLKSDASMTSRPLRHLRAENEWRFGPTVLTLCEHLFVSFTIRILRKHADQYTYGKVLNWNSKNEGGSSSGTVQEKSSLKWTVGKFVFSGIIAYLDGRLCRNIPNPIARRIVSGFLLSYIDNKERQ